jgi:hypothetical protein
MSKVFTDQAEAFDSRATMATGADGIKMHYQLNSPSGNASGALTLWVRVTGTTDSPIPHATWDRPAAEVLDLAGWDYGWTWAPRGNGVTATLEVA